MITTGQESEPLILPTQLQAARESLGLTVEEVADVLGIRGEDLGDWEKGHAQPPVEKLWELAKLYNRSTDYFLHPTPPLPRQLSFRLAKHKALLEFPLEVRKVIISFEELCRAQGELERFLGKTRNIAIGKVTGKFSPQELAIKERERLGLGVLPIANLRELLTKQGIKIFELPIPQEPIAGLSWWHKEYGPCILVNGRDNPGRRCFTLAHEYAHILQSDPPTICDLKVDVLEERQATAFAAAFLMPASDLNIRFVNLVGPPGVSPSADQLGTLARRYRVSLEALGRRLEELQLLPKGSTDQCIAEWEARPQFYRRPKSPTWRRRLGREFVSLAVEANLAGHISVGKMAQYLGQDIRKAWELVEERKTLRKSGGET